jgi:F-type H+-transporting ATPase subunit delta
MNYSKISVRYSKALFMLAKEKQLLEEVKNDMILIHKSCQEIRDFDWLLDSPVIQTTEKQRALTSIYKGKVNELTLSFINLVARNKRESFLVGISRNFIDIYRKEKGIKAVTLTSSIELDKKTVDKIISVVKEAYNTEIEVSTVVDEEIIGGYILRIDDFQLDDSVASKLKQLERELINTSFEYKILG